MKADVLRHFNVGVTLHNLGRPQEALAAFEKAVQVGPDHADARYSLAEALLAASRFQDAIAHYKVVTRLEPGKPRGFAGLGMTLHWAGQCAEAVTAFDKASRLCATCMEEGERVAYAICRTKVGR